MNIRVDLNYPIKDGTEVVFRSPVDCSQVTGLVVYYDNGTASKEFVFADAHGNNVGDIDHLFAENVAVKVILDVTTGMAFVQNADTNKYLEERLAANERMFWNYFQQNGERTDYKRAFVGAGWNDATYKPLYVFKEPDAPDPSILISAKITNANNMFYKTGITKKVEVDTSSCTDITNMFSNASQLLHIGTIDTSNISKLTGVFCLMGSLKTIDLLKLKNDGSQEFTMSCFLGDGKLENIRIEGMIGNNFNMYQCYRLNKHSIRSIINALGSEEDGVTGKEFKYSLLMISNTNIKDYITLEEFEDLIATKPNWTFNGV